MINTPASNSKIANQTSGQTVLPVKANGGASGSSDDNSESVAVLVMIRALSESPAETTKVGLVE